MSIRCPQCGEEYPLNQIPQERQTVRCSYCGQELSAGGLPQAEETDNPIDEMKALAERYFADIPAAPAEESGAPISKPAPKDEIAWSSEDTTSEEEKRRQRENLFQFAKEAALKAEETQRVAKEQNALHPKTKRFIREKRWQGIAYRILLLCVALVPLVRIMIGRSSASIEQFSRMQPQIVSSLLYFIAAVILPFPLLRSTVQPRLLPAILLLFPLVFDFWYLIPGIEQLLPAGVLLNLDGALKIAVSAFALIMSFKPRKHPALKYKEVENVHEPSE